MHFTDVTQVMEVPSVDEANLKLLEGWILISVVVTTQPHGHLRPCYILGKRETTAEKDSTD